jgi:hypothetical protein
MKSQAENFFNIFFFYRKVVKATVKSDRLEWLKFINENLKSHPKHFWKYVSKFRNVAADLIQLEANGTSLNTPYEIADAFFLTFSFWS